MGRRRKRQGRGWTREITEVEVGDSHAASVSGLSLSRARENRQGEGEREKARKQPRTYPSTSSPWNLPLPPPRVTTPSTRPHTYKMCVYVYWNDARASTLPCHDPIGLREHRSGSQPSRSGRCPAASSGTAPLSKALRVGYPRAADPRAPLQKRSSPTAPR